MLLSFSTITVNIFASICTDLYVGQETAVRTRHRTMDLVKIGKGVHQGFILTSCLFSFHADTSCKISGWINNKLESRFPGEISTTSDMEMIPLIAESEEELKCLLMRVKEECEKAGLKPNIQKPKIMAFSSITSWQIGGETMETVTDFIFLGFKITVDGDCSQKIKRCLLLARKAMKT